MGRQVSAPVYCQDYGDAPDCAGEADPRFVMDFTDIGEGYIHWCAVCGPRSAELQRRIEQRFEEDPDFQEKFGKAIAAAEQKQRENAQ